MVILKIDLHHDLHMTQTNITVKEDYMRDTDHLIVLERVLR